MPGTRATGLASRNFAIVDGVQPRPENTNCSYALERVGEDVAEKLGYAPDVFTVERHVRGKWVCTHCETRVQASLTPHVIDKGILERAGSLDLNRFRRFLSGSGSFGRRPRRRCEVHNVKCSSLMVRVRPTRVVEVDMVADVFSCRAHCLISVRVDLVVLDRALHTAR